MGMPIKKLPPGYEIGMRIRTNARYAVCYARTPEAEGRLGTIVGGSRGNDGPILVHLDCQKYPHPMTTNLFDIVESEGGGSDVSTDG